MGKIREKEGKSKSTALPKDIVVTLPSHGAALGY
jgi:hypothetical protein